MSSIQDSIHKFSNRLLEIDALLEEGKHNVTGVIEVEQKVFNILEEAVYKFERRWNNSAEESDALRDTVNRVFSDLGNGIKCWKQDMAERSEVRCKLEEMGTGLIVAVFGRTNSGKSTLGNFLRGKQLREAPFDNAWKNNEKFRPSKISVIEKSSDSEVTSEDVWFAEGSVETTREAQMFSLPGLLWLDTPGFGSVNDSSLGELARKYVKRADLVVYLENSDNPGLQSITKSLVEMLSEGRCTLIAINHSDMNETVKDADGRLQKDANGKVLRQRVAKSQEDRASQQEYLVSVLREKMPGKNVDAISISMLLAGLGVANGNEKQYSDSNIDSLFQKIIDLTKDSESIIRLKYKEAIQNCLVLVDKVIGNSATDEQCSLNILDNKLIELERRINEADTLFNIEEESKIIVAKPLLELRAKIHEILTSTKEKLDKSKDKHSYVININPELEAINKYLLSEIEKKAFKMLNDLWVKPKKEIEKSFPSLNSFELNRKVEKHTYEVTETESRERAPQGLKERFFHLFGRKYYGRSIVTRQKEQIIDLGFNVEEKFSEIMQDIHAKYIEFTEKELMYIREECLLRGAKMASELRSILECAKSDIEKLRQQLQ